jgi:hypothetical protein
MFGASVPFCLTAPSTPTLFGVFAFHHRRSPFITGVCTPSIRCLCNSSLSILACIGKVFACCLHQEYKRLPVVQTLTVSTLSFIWENFFSLHLLSHYNTSLNHGYSCTISVCLCAISVLHISPYSLLMFDSSSSCHNTYPSQNRVPIFIPLLYFSSIIRVFINSPLEKSQSPNLTSLEKSPLHQILEHTEPNCSLVPSSC